MPMKDRLSALLVVTLWGLNFIVIKWGVLDLPPLTLGALRFAAVAFPAILFLPRPRISFRLLATYALTISFGQFAFLFSAIAVGMPAGLASLVLQTQAFVTVLLGAAIFGETIRRQSILGLGVALAGMALLFQASIGDRTVPLLGFVLTLIAAVNWAVGNIVTKRLGPTDPLALVAWSALFPILPFALGSLIIDGPAAIQAGLAGFGWRTAGSVLYLALGASLIGYGLWSRLLARYPVWKIAPLTLAVPLIGLSSSWIVLDEALSASQILGAALMLGGLVINMAGDRLSALWKST